MLELNLKGKIAFIAGIGDDQGFGWAIAKALAEAGATLLIGTWTPIVKIFTTSLKAGKFDPSRRLSDGSLMEFAKIYPLDASFDTPEDIPEVVIEEIEDRSIPQILKLAGLAESTSKARTLISQGAVKINGERVEDNQQQLETLEFTLQVGQRRFAKIKIKQIKQ